MLYKTAFTVATKVKVGTITSSCLFTPITFNAKCNADVPLLSATVYLDFVNFEIFFSKSFISLPPVET